jgi:hypothetical protein
LSGVFYCGSFGTFRLGLLYALSNAFADRGVEVSRKSLRFRRESGKLGIPSESELNLHCMVSR